MRALVVILSLTFAVNAHSLTVLAQLERAIDAKPYLLMLEEKPSLQASHDITVLAKANGLPVKSSIQAGQITHHSTHNQNIPEIPFFVVGGDVFSRQWLNIHAAHLKKSGAIGYITNVEREDILLAMREESGIYLVPSNVDLLAKMVGAANYPFFTNGKEVWQ